MSHVALLLPDLELGGAERVMLLLAREFAARGHHVDLVLLRASGPLLTSIPEGVRLVDLAAQSHGFGQLGFSLSSVRRLAAWLKRERPDALLSTITGANFVAVLARKMAGIPLRLVIRVAGSVKFVSSALRLSAMRWLYPQADAVIALNPIMAEDLVERIGVPISRAHCIPNPLDTTFIREQGQAPITHPWLDNQQLRVVLAVGRLVPEKDYVTLLRAFALLPQNLFAHLIIIGEGSERAVLERLSKKLGIAERVQLVGLDVNPWRWMARADLFVLSSRWEGYPNVLFEALVFGLPAVVTEYDASVNDLAARYNFAVVPVAEPPALAKALEAMLREGMLPDKCIPCNETSDAVEKYLGVLAFHLLA